jgi:molecular chaperone HtpG
MSETAAKETLSFETEVTQLLHLMVHALYSNKEIFLRELVSNASDAADKLRFEGLKDDTLFEGDTEIRIKISYDDVAKTITIADNGIGMSRHEVIKNLGTIAKSGTQEFLKSLTGDESKDRHLIGQFGVGFYSGFIVADTITVRTRRAGLSADHGVEWTSKGEGDYSIETIDKPNRGTDIILHLKAGEEELLNGMRLRHIITKYSDHISLPIYMDAQVPPVEEGEAQDKQEVVAEEEIVNKATALWTLPKSDIEEENYKEFYKHVAHDFEDPLTWSHNKVEGKLEYTSLLYIPKKAPYDLWQPNKSRGLKLYVQRVFIMDDVEQFLPNYLRFVRGIVDCKDLPLNISREILQSSRVIDSIRAALVKRILGMMNDLSKSDSDQYQAFWNEFGQVIKEGPAEDFANKEAVAKLLRFASTHKDEEQQNVSLEAYLARMPEGQDKIYYVAADTFNAAKNSPHLEIFRQKGIEVILMHDRIDEWLMSHLTEFQGKQIQSVAQGSLDDLKFAKPENDDQVKEAKETLKQHEKEFESILKQMQEALEDKVKEVRLSERLTLSPSCIVADESGMTSQMERLLKSAGQAVASKPILEINPSHILIQRLKAEANSEHFKDLSAVLLDQAILAEGGQLEDPATFVKKFNELLLAMAK